jgi:zinc/manganese transport system substrate-binding protein
VLLACALGAAGCGSAASRGTPGQVDVVAGENFWGSIAAQIGGPHAHVTSILHDPNADPHLYESDPNDARALADADVVIVNGLGYDEFMHQLLGATSHAGRIVVTAATVLHVNGHDANPHLWYDVPRVPAVAAAIEQALERADTHDAPAFRRNLATFDASLRPALAVITSIKTRHAHAPVAYTERVPGYLVDAAGLDVLTPPGFAQAIEDGTEPSARDTAAMDARLQHHDVAVLLYNAQAASPVTQHARSLAHAAGVPVVAVTETLPSTEHTYQSWQLDQLQALLHALGG